MEESRNGNPNDFNMEQAMEMIHFMQEMMQPSGQEDRVEEKLSNVLDEHIQTPQLKAIYAAMPYLDRPRQKIVGLMVKMMEMQNLLSYFEQPSIQSTTSFDPVQMLSAMRPHLPESKQKITDMFLQFYQMQSVLKQYQMIQNIMKEA